MLGHWKLNTGVRPPHTSAFQVQAWSKKTSKEEGRSKKYFVHLGRGGVIFLCNLTIKFLGRGGGQAPLALYSSAH